MAKLGTGATSFSEPGAIEVELCSGDRDDCGEAAKLRTCRDFETPREVSSPCSFSCIQRFDVTLRSSTRQRKWLQEKTDTSMIWNSLRSLSHLSLVNDHSVRMSASWSCIDVFYLVVWVKVDSGRTTKQVPPCGCGMRVSLLGLGL